MPRLARLVVPGLPHHITQRGNRRQQTFFCDADFVYYLGLASELKERAGVEILAYCLMPNHVHFVAVPEKKDSLAKLFGVLHHRYARRTNEIHEWNGHLWQERYHSFVMDESHLLAAVRYIELNPVRAMLCNTATDWPWSSVHAHLRGANDMIVNVSPMQNYISDWSAYLSATPSLATEEILRQHTSSGRPAGSEIFIRMLELISGRRLSPQKPGPEGNS